MKLPEPSRGQPLDVSFIGQMVKSINLLWDKLIINASSYASIWTEKGRKALRASDIKVVTGRYDTAITTASATATTKPFTYDFDIAFKYPPIVTATPLSAGSTSTPTKALQGLRAIITETTTSRVTGIIVFEGGADAVTISVNIIAIGIPN